MIIVPLRTKLHVPWIQSLDKPATQTICPWPITSGWVNWVVYNHNIPCGCKKRNVLVCGSCICSIFQSLNSTSHGPFFFGTVCRIVSAYTSWYSPNSTNHGKIVHLETILCLLDKLPGLYQALLSVLILSQGSTKIILVVQCSTASRVDWLCKKKEFSLKSTDAQSNPLIVVIAAFNTTYEGNGELVNTH